MNNTHKRLLLFFLTFPVVFTVIFVFDWYKNIGVILFLSLIAFQSGYELRSMFSRITPVLPLYYLAIPPLSPILAWSVNMGWVSPLAALCIFLFVILLVCSEAVFTGSDTVDQGLLRIACRLVLVMYPAFLMWWIARMTWYEHAGTVIFIFTLSVIMNDSSSWFFGKLFGKKRNLVAVSPNKSLVGFIMGPLVAMVTVLASSLIVPDLFPHPLFLVLLFGLLTGIAATLGDLFESTIKRVAKVKDSGSFMIGRGGILDSFDSFYFAGPVFSVFVILGEQFTA